VHPIRLETLIAAPIGECFDLSLSVDAHTASMRASGERAVSGVTSGVLRLGDTVTWRARHFGIVFRMTSAITEYDYPSRFVDEQQRGPFRQWRHEHTFTAMPDGKTQMIDVVEFKSPLGSAGSIADGLLLRHYLPRLLRQRNTWLKATLEATIAAPGSLYRHPGGMLVRRRCQAGLGCRAGHRGSTASRHGVRARTLACSLL